MEQLANLDSTTLASAYTAGSGAIVVTSATGAPTSGTFSLLILNASTGAVILIFRVTSVAGTTFSGAAEGADANAPSASVVVGTMLTAAALAQIKRDAAGVSSYIWTPPSGLTLEDGAGGASLQSDAYGATLYAPSAGGNNIIYAQAPLSSGLYTLVVGFRGTFAAVAYAQTGVVISDGTKLITVRFRHDGTVDIYTWSAFNSPGGAAFQFSYGGYFGAMSGVIFKIVQDATHRTYFLGDMRLRQWWQIYQEAAGTYLTETQAGFFALSNNGSPALCECFHLTLS